MIIDHYYLLTYLCSWFTTLEQILEKMVGSVSRQGTLKESIVSVIEQFDDSGHIVRFSYT